MGNKSSKKKNSKQSKQKKKFPTSALDMNIESSPIIGWKMTEKHIKSLESILISYALTDILSKLLQYIPEIKPLKNFKITFDGCCGVGKSTLVVRWAQRIFVEDYDPTIEDIYIKETKILNTNTKLSLHMLDCAGNEEFNSLRDEFINEGQMLFFLEECNSSKFIVDEMKKLIGYNTNAPQLIKNNYPCILIITKCDLIKEYKNYCNTKREEILKKCNQLKIPYFEISTKECINVKYLFQTCYLEWLYQINIQKEKRNITKVFYSEPKSKTIE